MIYLNKQPLMIVGLLYLLFSSIPFSHSDETQDTNPVSAQVEGLTLPENAQSTIIPTDKATDIRVIIDISGSMKENDPDNLRIPALNLIVEMIPEGARAGVWTFGQWVNMLIPPAIVDDEWRQKAKQSAKDINSHGLRTNMGEAMEKATWLFETGGSFQQHAILLTDGLVDIAPESDPEQQAKNEAERQRIATQVLKNYEELGVKIHSIGLSDNADKVLLEKLALATGGSSVTVNSPQELVKAFLKAFEKAAPEAAEQVPLSDDNTFDIDENVQEFTALVFRKPGSNPLQLKKPNGEIISQIKGATNARWFGESVYDLVTVTSPSAGTWQVEADLDPDNRITVISDLKMEIRNLPNALFPGQQIDFEVFLHEKGKVISNPDFLKLMTVEMIMTAENGRSGSKIISDPKNPPTDGLYRESISRLSKEGQYELKIEVDGKTFKRMRKDYIQVRQPIGFEIRKTQLGKSEAYAVRVIPQVPDIEVAQTRVIAKLKGPDQSSIIQAMPWIEEGVWEAVVDPSKGPGMYEIAINIKGTIGKDQEFRVKPEPIKLTFPIPEDFSHEYLAQSEEQNTEIEESEVTEELEEKEEPAIPDTKESEQPESVQPETAESQESETEPETEEQKQPEAISEEAPAIPDLAEKMAEQSAVSEPEIVAPKSEDDVLTEEQKAALEPIPLWLYGAIPASVLVLGILGFLIFRKVAGKKQAPATTNKEKEDKEPLKEDVSLNDGLDDEDFDDDFDLSGDDDDDMSIPMEDNDETEETVEEPPELEEVDEPANTGETVTDDIPDFDENFDVENTDVKEESASAIDQLDNVLDSLSDDDEENIPQLEEAVDDEFDLSNDSDVKDEDEAESMLPDLDNEEAISEEDENAIDEALANLESELDDIDVDALMDDEKKE